MTETRTEEINRSIVAAMSQELTIKDTRARWLSRQLHVSERTAQKYLKAYRDLRKDSAEQLPLFAEKSPVVVTSYKEQAEAIRNRMASLVTEFNCMSMLLDGLLTDIEDKDNESNAKSAPPPQHVPKRVRPSAKHISFHSQSFGVSSTPDIVDPQNSLTQTVRARKRNN